MLLDPYLLLWLVSFCTAVTRADFCCAKNGWVMGSVGEPVVLPCNFVLSPPVDDDDKLNLRITWTKLGEEEVKVLQAHDGAIDVDPAFKDRVSIPKQRASLTILRLRASDSGTYQCQVFQGPDATVETLSLDVSGVCFHYRGNRSSNSLNFEQAKKACEDIDASIASPDQLLSAYEDGYDQCDAGWLSDQTVRYPIVTPRVNCESDQPNEPGVRNYGKKSVSETFDVYCCAAKLQGDVFYAGVKLSLSEASEECVRRKASLASTGQLYAAWRRGMHRCDYGWLSDGSVRSPFSDSKAPCDEHTPGVRTFYRNKTLMTFPLPDEKFGAYCFTENIKDVNLLGSKAALIEGESSAFFTCDAYGDITSVKWLKDGEDLSTSNRISFSPDERSVSISPVMRSDTGVYQCRAESLHFSHATDTIILTVSYGPEDVQISGPDEVYAGTRVTLTCSAASGPSASYSWSLGTNTTVSEDTFLIPESDVTHSGEYTCTVTNHITERSVSTSHALLVKGPTVCQNDISTITEQKEKLQNNISTITEQRNKLQNDISTITEQKEKLQNDISTITEQKEKLQNNISTITEQKEKLQNNISTITEQKEKLQNDISTISEQKEKLQNDISTITDQRNKLQNDISNLRHLNEELNQEKAAWKLFNPGWIYHEGSLYFFSSERKSWSDSLSYCRRKGADLIIINSKEENDFAKSKGHDFWIGLSDREIENDWKWVDGSKVNFSFWHSSEPNNLGNEDCARFEIAGRWNDARCSLQHTWICEKKMN